MTLKPGDLVEFYLHPDLPTLNKAHAGKTGRVISITPEGNPKVKTDQPIGGSPSDLYDPRVWRLSKKAYVLEFIKTNIKP